MIILNQTILQNLGYCILLLCLLAACIYDFRQYRIPNKLVITLLMTGLAWQTYSSEFTGMLHGLFAGAIAFTIFLGLYLIGAMGAGDVKLIGAACVFMDEQQALYASLVSLSIGSFLGLSILIIKGGLPAFVKRYYLMVKTWLFTFQKIYIPPTKSEVASEKFPFAVAIALGVSVILLKEPLQKIFTISF